MRTIYENYRGFIVWHHENQYKAINDDIIFCDLRLSCILNAVDHYIEAHFNEAILSPPVHSPLITQET